MKKVTILCIALSLIIGASIFIVSCKKSNSSDKGCGIMGGIISPDYYVLWIGQDFGGPVTVRLFEDGKELTVRYNTTDVYDRSEPLQSCNSNDQYYNDRARLELYRGHTYTYKASTSSKAWSGTIIVPCQTDDNCHRIELK